MTSEVMLVDTLERAATMMKPLRVAMLSRMAEPVSCPELAHQLGETPQKIYYHVKTMERAGLVDRTGERNVNGIAEGFYRSRARSFWFSPELARDLGGPAGLRDNTSLGILAGHAEQMLVEVGKLAQRTETGEHVPSLSLSVEIDLPDESRRSRFLDELRQTFEQLAARYTGANGVHATAPAKFRFTIACYPHPAEEESP